MTRLGRPAVALALLAASGAGCDWFTPRPPRGFHTPAPVTQPEPGCEACGDTQRKPATYYRVEAPASVRAGKAATFTFWTVVDADEAVICEVPAPRADMPDWGAAADASPPHFKLGLLMDSVVRDEQRPCAEVNRAAPPRSLKATRTFTFPTAGSWDLELVGYVGALPPGMLYSPGPGDPPGPPKPSAPATIEVQE